jgi:hypothetical protein
MFLQVHNVEIRLSLDNIVLNNYLMIMMLT